MKAMRGKSYALIQVFALGLLHSTMTGCLPIPHFQQESPDIEGTIKRNGVFAKNIEVVLAVNQQFTAGCRNGKQRTRTDSNGRFSVKETTYFDPVFMFGDRGDGWSLCFKFPDGVEVVWSDRSWWGGPPLQHLECVINDTKKISPRIELNNLEHPDTS